MQAQKAKEKMERQKKKYIIDPEKIKERKQEKEKTP